MNLLVIGSGGREHALCRTLKLNASGPRPRIFCAPGNAGIAGDAECVAIGATDGAALADFAASQTIKLTIPGARGVGPPAHSAKSKKMKLTMPGGEASLAAGLADEFMRRGLLVAGPTREA